MRKARRTAYIKRRQGQILRLMNLVPKFPPVDKEKAKGQDTKKQKNKKKFQSLVHEAQQRKVQYYLEGLEVERKRLAKELHDNVSNELNSLSIKCLLFFARL